MIIEKTKGITRLAGVSFANDATDGGESRQELLKQIYNNGLPVIVTIEPCIFHNTDTNCDEDAIKVRQKSTGKILGWIPREDIDRCKSIDTMTLTVGFYKNTYNGVLNPNVAPTAKQYSYMKYLHSKGLIQCMPEYDKAIYSRVLIHMHTYENEA